MMFPRCRWVVVTVLFATAFALNGAHAAVITPKQVAKAISSAGFVVNAMEITFVDRATSSSEVPHLIVGPMQLLGGEKMAVNMHCADSTPCSPFRVIVHWGEKQGGQLQASAAPFSGPNSSRNPGPAATVRAGSSVILTLEADHIRIQIPVISLQSGGIGQQIRVTSRDRRQMYTAEIVDSNHLRGRLD